jgi:hypothetical protein
LKELKIVEYKGIRILTTAQSAEFLGTDTKHINDNFQNNKKQYTPGEDYFFLEGSELKKFKIDNPEIFGVVSRLNSLYLWTEYGVMLHVKSINTNEAWNAYKTLLREYFRLVAKEKQSQQEYIFTKDVQRRCMLRQQTDQLVAKPVLPLAHLAGGFLFHNYNKYQLYHVNQNNDRHNYCACNNVITV